MEGEAHAEQHDRDDQQDEEEERPPADPDLTSCHGNLLGSLDQAAERADLDSIAPVRWASVLPSPAARRPTLALSAYGVTRRHHKAEDLILYTGSVNPANVNLAPPAGLHVRSCSKFTKIDWGRCGRAAEAA